MPRTLSDSRGQVVGLLWFTARTCRSVQQDSQLQSYETQAALLVTRMAAWHLSSASSVMPNMLFCEPADGWFVLTKVVLQAPEACLSVHLAQKF